MSGLYTVAVVVVGSASVTVHADSAEEAHAIAEACITPLHVNEWSYVADEVTAAPSH